MIGVGIRRIVHHSAELELRAGEAERTAFSRELHDVAAHHVASIALSIGVAKAVQRDLTPQP